MTRKDYVAIAEAIEITRTYAECAGMGGQIALDLVSGNIADEMSADNPRFDRARFLKACGVQS